VFRAFARTVDQARERIVVLDTAPTGHTLLLLDAAQSYQREVQRTNANVPAEVSELLTRLRDPEFARMLVVTLAESTPVQEAARLQEDLRRAGIEPFGWVINASLAASGNHAPHAARPRQPPRLAHIDRVAELSEHATWLVGWQLDAPVGAAALRELVAGCRGGRTLMRRNTPLRRGDGGRFHKPITATRRRPITLAVARHAGRTAPTASPSQTNTGGQR
jgi:arsenite-transporting ATPase